MLFHAPTAGRLAMLLFWEMHTLGKGPLKRPLSLSKKEVSSKGQKRASGVKRGKQVEKEEGRVVGRET